MTGTSDHWTRPRFRCRSRSARHGKPRALLITHSFPPNVGGVEEVVSSLAAGLRHYPTVSADVLTLAPAEASDDARFAPARILRGLSLAAIRTATAYDVFVFHSPVLKLSWLPLLTGKPRINVIHGRMFDADDPAQVAAARSSAPRRAVFHLTRRLKLAFLKSADLRIAVSAAVADETGPGARIVHNGCDHSTFTCTAPIKNRDPRRIVFVGRLSPEKGVSVLVDAIRQLESTGEAPHLDVIGDGPCREELEARVASAGLSRKVTFLGKLSPSSVAARLNDSAIAVVPSLSSEAYGLVGVEAQACGCAVVASDVGGLPEALGEATLLVKPGSASDLARALRELADPQTLHRLAARGQAHARQATRDEMVRNHAEAISVVASRECSRRRRLRRFVTAALRG